MDKLREDSINDVLTALQDLAKNLTKGSYGCSFDCNCMLLGGLVKAMDALNLISSQPASPYNGLSYNQTLQALRTMRSPGPCSTKSYKPFYTSQDCSFTSIIGKHINSLEAHVNWLELRAYNETICLIDNDLGRS